MASRSKPVVASSQPQSIQVTPSCDFCHQKPKFNNFKFCSKTCAAQAATLCQNCHKKPKYQNYEYCSKACAASAVGKPFSTGSKSTNKGATVPAQGNQTIDPVQIAKLIMQHIPQLQTVVPQPAQNSGATVPVSNQIQSALPPPPVQKPAQKAKPQNNPFMDPNNIVSAGNGNPSLSTNSQPFKMKNAAGGPPLTLAPINTAPTICLIPDCNQPVYQEQGSLKPSQYCSQKHREEAVASGLISPCIFCMGLPQSETDYFCGRQCREEALDKTLIIAPAYSSQ